MKGSSEALAGAYGCAARPRVLPEVAGARYTRPSTSRPCASYSNPLAQTCRERERDQAFWATVTRERPASRDANFPEQTVQYRGVTFTPKSPPRAQTATDSWQPP